MTTRIPEPGATAPDARRSVREAARCERPFLPRLARPSEELPRALRPREKLFARGVRCLSAVELIALILGAAGRRESAQCVAERLLRQHRLRGLAALPSRAWLERSGVGQAAAARLCAAFEIGRRAHARERKAERTLSR